MELFLLFARLILAGVFGVAGIAKLFDREGGEKAIVGFGVPEKLAKPLAVILPLTEILTAILLLPLATAWVGATAALTLLLVFVGGIVYNLIRGEAPDCHCFGQIHSEPVGWSTLIRNAVLAAIAGFVVFGGRENAGLSAFLWFADLTAGERMQFFGGLIICGLLAAIFWNLRKILVNQVVLQRQIEILELTSNEGGTREVEREEVKKPAAGLPVGAVAPDFVAADLKGKQVTLEHLLMRGKPVLLFFVSPSCSPCTALVPVIEKLQRAVGVKLTIALFSNGTTEENFEKFGRFDDGKFVLLQKEREVAAAFRSQWTPGAVLINADGTIGSALATGDREILDLLDIIRPRLLAAVEANGHGQPLENFLLLPKKKLETLAPKAGDAAPNFTLPTLDGGEFSLDKHRKTDKKTLMLFWRETCGYCQQMSADLQAWERGQNEFNLLIVANDEPEIEQARMFSSPVLIESNLEVQRLYDTDGTPVALLIDENGKIASDVASGAEDVFALVGYSPEKR